MKVTEADDVTEDVLESAEKVYDGWFADADRIDWDDFISRLENRGLEDGTELDLGDSMLTPAIEKIKRHIRTYRRLG